MLAFIGVILTGLNLYGFYKCRGGNIALLIISIRTLKESKRLYVKSWLKSNIKNYVKTN